jgi:diketogulonate reductase-like aldo/keto reductase
MMTAQPQVLKRPIPGTGEVLPVIGLGTWQTFDVGDDSAERAPLLDVLKTLSAHGARVIDSSPMYGRSEEVVGSLSTELGLNDKLFIATKVWINGKDSGIKQMTESMSLLRRKKLDLMQIHNITDWRTHLPTLRQWKDEGRIRYIGITHYTENAYSQVEDILKKEPLDFLQINYSLTSRRASDRLFPLAQEKGIAVLINRPFEEGALFRKAKGMPLPEWSREFDCTSWAQFFLKFILTQPAVTCIIPGTSKKAHMMDNLQAGLGRLPDPILTKKMVDLFNQ